ncbi:MAG TPA: GNVR domain-containing protein, partial [Steroidobacteraceae bacterium]|nr:GNVR domain-containing protein [Steroidobacteraceae bacterium]
LHGEEKLRELSTQYGANHPAYQRQVSQNLELRGKLQAEQRKVAASLTNPDAQPLPRLASAQSAQDPAQARMLEPVLQHNVESAEHAYDTALQRYFSSQIDSRASQTNVTVLSAAAVPFNPYRPNIPLNLALSLVTGLGLGVALVALLEKTDARVRSAEDLMFALQVPLLAELGDEGRPAGLLPSPAPADGVRALPRPG